jgi:formylglycine-generating enzyme required for sulfatase activity
MNMKKVILLSSIVALLSACGGSGNGELIGVQKRQIWNPTDPYGMVYIPQGSYTMGPSDQDVPFANVSASKTVSVGAFYMDETEITNNEYRQFTNWVRDSIARKLLADQLPDEWALMGKRWDGAEYLDDVFLDS